MNFQSHIKKGLIKVLMFNPLVPSSQLILLKVLSGEIFGNDNCIDLNLFVQSEEMMAAEVLKVELEKCAFSNASLIQVSTDFPNVHDADIFCFMSDFENPNYIDIERDEGEFEEDIFYLLLKFANNLSWPTDEEKKEAEYYIKRKPILMADGVLALNILSSFSTNLPYDIFYCPSPIEAISKSVLGDHLNDTTGLKLLHIGHICSNNILRNANGEVVQCNKINDVLVWGASDIIFHVEVEKPLIISDKVHNGSGCGSDTISKELLHSLKLDYTKFNSTWMRKEFLEKVASSAARNPYGCIYKAAEFAKSLKQIWKARSGGSGMKVYSNMGVISDGSIGTMKGYPYFLPLVLTNDSWVLNQSFAESTYLRQEMKRINKAVVDLHDMVLPYCIRALKENNNNLLNTTSENETTTICEDSGSTKLLQE